MDLKAWETKNAEHLAEIDRDDDLNDYDYLSTLEDLIMRARENIDAKREELDREQRDAND